MGIRLTSNFIALNQLRSMRQMLTIFSGVEFWKLYRSSGKEYLRKSLSCVLTSSTKPEFRHFHVVVVQWRQRNGQKRVMHVQSCRFANLQLLLFSRSCWRHRSLSSLSGTLSNATTTASAVKTSLKKWICVLSNLIPSIWTRSICQIQVTFPGVEFLRILFKFKKRKENSLSYVHVLHKTSNKDVSRRSRGVDVKEMY